jgi:hypothetical protein
MAINAGKLSHIVQDFVARTSDVQGAAVVTPDGLPLASSLPVPWTKNGSPLCLPPCCLWVSGLAQNF